MIYFLICILAVYFNVFKDVNAFTGGDNFHLWKDIEYFTLSLTYFPIMWKSNKIYNDFDRLILFCKLLLIYLLIRFMIFDYAYGFFAHDDFDYLGNSLYDTIIGLFPVWLIAVVKSVGFIYSAILSYKIFK